MYVQVAPETIPAVMPTVEAEEPVEVPSAYMSVRVSPHAVALPDEMAVAPSRPTNFEAEALPHAIDAA